MLQKTLRQVGNASLYDIFEIQPITQLSVNLYIPYAHCGHNNPLTNLLGSPIYALTFPNALYTTHKHHELSPPYAYHHFLTHITPNS